MPHIEIPLHQRRWLYAKTTNLLLPTEVVDPMGSLQNAEEEIQKGKTLLVIQPHFSEDDILRTLAMLASSSRIMQEAPCLAPIAFHMSRTKGLPYLCRFTEVDLSAIVTKDTKDKEVEYREKGKKVKWDSALSVGFGKLEYMNRVVAMIRTGGGVDIFAPSISRQSHLEPFVERATATLCIAIRGKENKKEGEKLLERVSVLFMGVEAPGVEDYSTLKGLSVFRRNIITLGEVVPLPELIGDDIKTVDLRVHERMLKLAPPAYRPRQQLLDSA